MTKTYAPCEIFEFTSTDGNVVLAAYSPAKFDKRLVSALKARRGIHCVKDAHGFRWQVRADHASADDFRAAFAAAAERQGGAQITAANLAHHMYDPSGALFG